MDPRKLFFKSVPIIDAHVHTFFRQAEIQGIAKDNGVDFSIDGLRKDCAANNVLHVCAIYNDFDGVTPIDDGELAKQQEEFPAILGVGVLHPFRMDKNSLKRTEKAISDGVFRALKVYGGYYPTDCTDKRFAPYYKLAAKYNIPVYVHTGDTIKQNAQLRFCRPMAVDTAAVAFPDTKFIITQMGNPWLPDAAEVAFKNDNVWVDTAGVFSGMRYNKMYTSRIQYFIDFVDNPSKFMFGSDWPVARMRDYIAFIRTMFPKEMHQKLFHDNAKKLFRL
jgi:predicted TIM-barrel fold metal-dependent hydrolase